MRASAVNTLNAFLRVETYNPIIDKAVSELKCRFSDENADGGP